MATVPVEQEQQLMTIPEYPNLRQDALTIKSRAESLVIQTADDYTAAAEIAKGCQGLIKQIEAGYDGLANLAHKLHKAIIGKKNEYMDEPSKALTIVKQKMGAYQAEQERIRRAEEARLQEEARKKAEEEARKLAEEQALQDAIELEAQGDKKGAEAVLANPAPVTPVYVAPIVLPKQVPQAAGIAARKTYKFRVVSADKVKREYMVPDEKKIGQVVRALGLKAAEAIGGIEVYEETNIAVRA